jgi:AcrR family transcriptional regulator
VPETSNRESKARETRARIGEAALDLFMARGYAETTIDEIAARAGVGRRTVFRYFPTKQATLFDHLVVRREVTIEKLQQRPAGEPPLVSLHAVLRQLCEHGYDRQLLTQIRAVLLAEPKVASAELSAGNRVFQAKVVATLQERYGDEVSLLELLSLTGMAFGWFLSAVQIYLFEGRRSLVKTFDEVVAACVRGTAVELGPPPRPGRRAR